VGSIPASRTKNPYPVDSLEDLAETESPAHFPVTHLRSQVANHLYRRNGRYYARMRIPQSLQAAYGGRPDLRASLNTTDYSQARQRVLEVALQWTRSFARLRAMLDARQIVTGSAMLVGDGLLSLESAARECGLAVSELLREALNRRVELRIEAAAWRGVEVASQSLDYDHDGALILNSALDGRDLVLVVGTMYLRRASLLLISQDLFFDCLFFRDARRTRAVVVPLPGVTVNIGSLLISKIDAEAIRAGLAANVTPAMLEAASLRRLMPPVAVVPGHKHGDMLTSELLSEFFNVKMATWSEATKAQTPQMIRAFVELMNDPKLADVDGQLMLRYRERLMTLPSNLKNAKRSLNVTALADLIAAWTGPKMQAARADGYLAKLSEVFKWAVQRGFMVLNPVPGIAIRRKKARRQQDDRHAFTDANLSLIFSAPWFATGKGKLSTTGKYVTFAPFMFWLPLLGLYAGGRLNELAQLYLADVQRTPAGTWFIEITAAGAQDKRLKTVNAERKIPLHSELLRLGFVDYVHALRDAGHERVFPELRYDKVKGFGKAAAQWFDERFLGVQLGIHRDGKQSFHSFRHSFVSALTHLKPPIGEFTTNQLSGHERGQTTSGNRYAKDEHPDVLRAYIDRLEFNIPTPMPFDVAEGLTAVKHALARKHK
jgi:integrase